MPSQALPRQLPQRGSQGLKPVAKVLGAMRKFPAVLLPLPLRKDFPRSGGRCRVATKGGVWHRAAMTERAHAVAPVAKSIKCNDTVSGIAQRRPLGGAGAQRLRGFSLPPKGEGFLPRVRLQKLIFVYNNLLFLTRRRVERIMVSSQYPV